MASNSFSTSSATPRFSMRSSSLEDSKTFESPESDDFRRLLLQLSNELDEEDDRRNIRFLYKRKLGRGKATEKMSTLQILERLVEKGEFSADNLGPLEELLKNSVERHDLISDYVKPYRRTKRTRVIRQLIQAEESDAYEEIGSISKRARLQPRGLNVSKIKREYNHASAHGIIVRVSRIHKPEDNPTNKYFQADITDGKKTLLFKCYDTHLRSTMTELCRERKAVTLEDCRVKQSTRRDTRGDFELLSNPETKVVENPDKDFAIPADQIEFFTHTPTLQRLQKLKEIKRDERVTVMGKIVSIEGPVEVERNTGEKLNKQDCWLADQSMRIKLEIWEEEIGTVEVGSSYCFIDVRKKEYDGNHFLSTTMNSEIIEIESIGDDLSTETIPNTNGEIHGEISAVEKVTTYRECTSERCKGKVTPTGMTKGRCNKCKRMVKLSKCETSTYAKFTVEETASKKANDVTAFNERVLQIIDREDLAILSESDIESMLFDAEPATFVIDQEKVVVEVKRD